MRWFGTQEGGCSTLLCQSNSTFQSLHIDNATLTLRHGWTQNLTLPVPVLPPPLQLDTVQGFRGSGPQESPLKLPSPHEYLFILSNNADYGSAHHETHITTSEHWNPGDQHQLSTHTISSRELCLYWKTSPTMSQVQRQASVKKGR